MSWACRSLRVLLVVFAVTLGCGGSQKPAPARVLAGGEGAVAELLGVSPSVVAVVHPQVFMAQPMFGWSLAMEAERQAARTPSGPSAAAIIAFFEKSTRVEAYFARRDAGPTEELPAQEDDPGLFGEWSRTIVFAVLVRGKLGDPSTLLSRAGEPMFAAVTRLPSGVAEYRDAGGKHRAHTFVLADGSWLFVDARTAVRARSFLSTASTLPTAVSVDEDVMAALFLGRELVDLLRQQAVEEPARSIVRDLQAVTLVARTTPRRSMDVVLQFADAAQASSVERTLRRAFDQKAFRECAMLPDWCSKYASAISFERSDDRVVLVIPD